MTGAIDVHHHLVPPAYAAIAARRGVDRVAGAPLPDWRPEQSLAIMGAHDIATAILSHAAPGVHFGDDQEARDLARACNDYAAELADRHRGRLAYFAVLPMPLAEAACAEAAHALDHLGAAGVVLLGSAGDVFLGDPRFEDLMAELDRRSTVVFVHPNIHPTSTQLGLDIPGFFVEFPCDTTRATANLLFSGTFERHPWIRWILSHAGGFVPFIAWRLALADHLPPLAANAPKGVLHYLRNLYYDTALSPSPMALSALKHLVDPSHILFGSDFPFAPAPVVAQEWRTLAATTVLSGDELAAVRRSNALALFPQLR